jgi:hypothetical protein
MHCMHLFPSLHIPLAGFQPAAGFEGRRPGWVFKLGPHGLGYYSDMAGPNVAGMRHAAVKWQDATWTHMRTVGELRREAGVAPPREADSLYRCGHSPHQPCRLAGLKLPCKADAHQVALRVVHAGLWSGPDVRSTRCGSLQPYKRSFPSAANPSWYVLGM